MTHPDLTTLPVDEVKRQVCNDRAQLASWGFPTRSFAYPFASTNATVQSVVKACGYNSGRNLGDIRSKACPTGCALAETIPPANPYETKALDEYDNTWTLADLEAPVLAAQSRGGWLEYTFHDICVTTCDSIGITPTLLTQFVQWLAARTTQSGQNTVVKPVGTVIGGTVKPLVNGPAVPPPASGGNGVVNPRLEAAASGVPNCWWDSSYSTNSPSFSLVPGHSGSVASRITMTGYFDRDSKLAPDARPRRLRAGRGTGAHVLAAGLVHVHGRDPVRGLLAHDAGRLGVLDLESLVRSGERLHARRVDHAGDPGRVQRRQLRPEHLLQRSAHDR